METINLLSQVVEVAGRIHQIEPRDWMSTYSLRWAIYEALQTLLDSCSMMTAELGLRKPSSYAELADILAEAGVLGSEEASKLKALARVRNRVAHTYRRLGLEELKGYGDEAAKSKDLALKLMEEARKRGVDPPSSLTEALTPLFRRWRVSLAYLFGSRAKGVEAEDSDWDIAVLFEEEPTALDELQVEVAKALKVAEDKVDLVTLNDADLHLKFKVIKEGRLLYESKPKLKAKFESQVLIEYLDARGMYEIYLNKLLKNKIPST
ncbi:MAG: hypothetical protein DRJ97_07615 [Thermoprotei archaeon]|nr:MAG: hypothetical protein DRJ97_07615 [Thermoprotei archaeon]